MNVPLDTNACVALINGEKPGVEVQFAEAIRAGDTLHLASIVLFELLFRVWKSTRQELNHKRLTHFLSGPLISLPLEATEAQAAGRTRTHLRKIGNSVGDYDLLIAAQATLRNMILVTHNVNEFGQVPGLVIDDWRPETRPATADARSARSAA